MAIYLNGVLLRDLGLIVADRPQFRDTAPRKLEVVGIHGRAGGLVSEAQTGPREGQLVGTLYHRTRASLESAVNRLADLFAGTNVLRDISPTGQDLLMDVVLTGRIGLQLPSPGATSYRVTVPLLAPDPFWRAVQPTLRALVAANTRYTVPLGTAPSSPIFRVTGTNPVLTYRDAGGAIVRQTTFTVTLNTSTDYLDVDMRRGKITKYLSGTASNGRSALTSGDWPWALDPEDGDVTAENWPTVECSTANARVLYWKRYR